MKIPSLPKNKALLMSCLLVVFFTLIKCNSSQGNKNETPEAVVPVELKDSAVIEADEDKALEKLNHVIDSAK